MLSWLSLGFGFISSITGLLLTFGVPGLILVLYLESQPRIKPEEVSSIVDYPAGLQTKEYKFTVEMGRIPYLNRLFFLTKTVSTVRFITSSSVRLRLTVNPGIESHELEGKYWGIKAGSEPKLFLRRGGFPPSVDFFTLEVDTYQERSRPEIRNLLEQRTTINMGDTDCNIIHRIINSTDTIVKDFEVNVGLPQMAKMMKLTTWKTNGRRQKVEFDVRDFWIRFDTAKAVGTTTSEIPKQSSSTLVGIMNIEKGITEIEIEYTKNVERQMPLIEPARQS